MYWMTNNRPTLSILITTMNENIQKVKQNLLPSIRHVDQIVISHQITNEKILPEKGQLWNNIFYTYAKEKGLSRNRNLALAYATGDICYFCDDDLSLMSWFDKTIIDAYMEEHSDVITFQAIDEFWKKHFNVRKSKKHSQHSLLNIWSWGITCKRSAINNSWILFDERFWLGAKHPVSEESIFLIECYRKWLKMRHVDIAIATHPQESSGMKYRKDLITWRVAAIKKLYGRRWSAISIMIYAVLHRPLYRKKYSPWQFLHIAIKQLNKKI